MTESRRGFVYRRSDYFFCDSAPALRWIIPAGMPRMAAQNAACSPPSAANRTMLLHRTDKVIAASRVKPAISPDPWTQRPLIDPHQANQEQGRQIPQQAGEAIHKHSRYGGLRGWEFLEIDAADRGTRRASWLARRINST
jgi:hypothetical protein